MLKTLLTTTSIKSSCFCLWIITILVLTASWCHWDVELFLKVCLQYLHFFNLPTRISLYHLTAVMAIFVSVLQHYAYFKVSLTLTFASRLFSRPSSIWLTSSLTWSDQTGIYFTTKFHFGPYNKLLQVIRSKAFVWLSRVWTCCCNDINQRVISENWPRLGANFHVLSRVINIRFIRSLW